MCPWEFIETQFISTLGEVDVGRLAADMSRSYSIRFPNLLFHDVIFTYEQARTSLL